MKKKTLWQEGITLLPEVKQDYRDKDVDILIIGGGITGMTALYQLSTTSKNVLLIDKDKIGLGVTSNTTGKLTYLQDEIYEQIMKTYDVETATSYLQAQVDAMGFVKKTIQKEQIDCNYEEVPSYVFADKNKDIDKINVLDRFLKLNRISTETKDKLPIDIPTIRTLKISDSAVFHPVKYIYGLLHICLKRKMKVLENVRATDIDQDGNFYIVHTNTGKIRAKKVLICTHYPFFIKPGWIPMKTHIESSYVVASQIERPKKISAISITKPTISIRYHKDKNDYLLLASESDKITKCKNKKVYYEKIDRKFHSLFRGDISYRWSTHDIMPNDHLPLIGPVSKKHPNVMIATGYQKWGMTNGTIAGIILANLALDGNNRYEKLFLPYRPYNMNRCIQTIFDGIENTKAMIISYFKTTTGNARIEIRDGKKVGVYQDETGKEHLVSIICPHMKCHLLFNEIDFTWDCPCHGSRFDIDGHLLEGPSVFDITHKNE